MFARMLALTAFLAPIATGAYAQQSEPGQLADSVFDTIDADGDGQATREEFRVFDQQVLTSMDTDENGGISEEEFLNWGFGFSLIADERGRGESFQTGGRIMFAIMDYDANGEVSAEEMDGFQDNVFAYSDQDKSGNLSAQEYHDHHFTNIAVRKALSDNQ